MISKANLTWRQAVLSALVMSSAVSANYHEQTRNIPEPISAARSIERIQERSLLDTVNLLIGGLVGRADEKAAAADTAEGE